MRIRACWAMWQVLAVAAIVLVGAPPVARAWTEAAVRTVRTHVEILPDHTARVAMEVRVAIRRGWLEGLDVSGLDPGLVLNEDKPPWVVSVDGERKYRPRVTFRRGRLSFSFSGRRSPRRGSVLVGILYTTDLGSSATALADGGTRLVWTLPAWRSGLDGASITVTAPLGTRAEPSGPAPLASRDLSTRDFGDRTVLRWRRPHLPRTVPWAVRLDVPAAHPASPPAEVPAAPTLRAEPVPREPSSVWVITLLAVLLWARRRLWHRRCAQLGLSPRSLVPLPAWAHFAVLAAGAAWAVLGDGRVTFLVALCLMATVAIERTPRQGERALRPGRWRPALSVDQRRARRRGLLHLLGWYEPLDLTSLPFVVVVGGLLGAQGWASGVANIDWAACILLVPFLTGTRHHLPLSPERRLLALLHLARGTGVDWHTPCALRPFLHVAGRGTWQEARLSCALPEAPDGLVRLDLAIAQVRSTRGYVAREVLLVVARADSPAARLVASALADVTPARGPGGRLGWVASVDAGYHGQGSLARCLYALGGGAKPVPLEPLMIATGASTSGDVLAPGQVVGA